MLSLRSFGHPAGRPPGRLVRATRAMLGLVAVAALALVAPACGDSTPTEDMVVNNPDGGGDAGPDLGESLISAPTLPAIQSDLLMKACIFSSCHSTTAHEAGLIMSDEMTSCMNLVNVPATTAGAAAQNLMRVKPGDAENSFLYQKLAAMNASLGNYNDDPSLPLGDRMPKGSDPLDAATLATIADWINSGADCQ